MEEKIKIGDKIRLSVAEIVIEGHYITVEEAYNEHLISLERYSDLQPYIGYVLDIDDTDVLLNTGNGQMWVNYRIRNVAHL